MKLRIRADTLRLRLTRSEVDRIAAGETIEEITPFPDGTALTYALRPGSVRGAEQVASDAGTRIDIEIPSSAAVEWAQSLEVGFCGEHPFQLGPLAVLIEKDFTCITPREGEEELDTFPNPNAVSPSR